MMLIMFEGWSREKVYLGVCVYIYVFFVCVLARASQTCCDICDVFTKICLSILIVSSCMVLVQDELKPAISQEATRHSDQPGSCGLLDHLDRQSQNEFETLALRWGDSISFFMFRCLLLWVEPCLVAHPCACCFFSMLGQVSSLLCQKKANTKCADLIFKILWGHSLQGCLRCLSLGAISRHLFSLQRIIACHPVSNSTHSSIISAMFDGWRVLWLGHLKQDWAGNWDHLIATTRPLSVWDVWWNSCRKRFI